ncbi:ATP-binding protein [Nonomuraea purpurea]|uniref:ATP-binding protein n=1 Tax=Nonomuraea purpurea TaxID=1849276 RepID=A0ABV8G3N3_9ACTN
MLVGRKEALGAVEGVLAAGAGCVVVEGPAGIGKSRLLEAAVALGRSRGMSVGAGRATELDRVAPLSTLTRSLGMLREHGSPGALEGTDGLRRIERIGDAVERLARHRPLAIVLDDVQWADELTCLALRHLIPSLAASPVIWLLGRRPLPEQEAVEQLIAEGARRVVLPPLTLDECAELSGQILGAEPDASVTELARASGGNPFLLEEVLTGLRDEGRVSVTDGVAAIAGAVGGIELPVRLVAAVERRLRDLSGEARRLLEVAAVLRRPFTVHEAAGMLGVPPARLFSCLEEAVGAGAVVEDGERLAFRHDLIREAVYGGLTAPIRTALHREAAAVLRAEGRPPAELAEHLRHGARLGDVAAIGELRAAAEEMMSVAPSAAADLMLRALELAGSPGTGPGDRAEPPAFRQGEHDGRGAPGTGRDGRAEPPRPGPDGRNRGRREAGGLDAGLVAGVVRLLASAGRLEEARRVADAPGAPLSAAEEAGIVLGLAEALKHAGDDHGVIQRTGRVLGRPGVPVLERARLLAVRAHALMMTGGIDAADVAAAQAVATGEVFAQVVGLQARSTVALFRGELDGALRHAEQSVRLADAAGGEVAHRHPRLWLGAALEEAGRRGEALAIYRSCGVVVAGRRGAPGRGWEALTAAELRVVRLVARGMTNREAAAELFLSPHTVDSHLRHAFAKLGVSSRVELTRQVLAHEPAD